MKRIKEQLKHQFDWVIGIANGGVVPAIYLSYELNLKAFDTFCISFYDGEIQKEDKSIIDKDYSHIKGKKVLLVDDLVDTGRTMTYAMEYLQKFNPALIQTAVIYKKEGSTFKPDYAIKECSRDLWIDFPWEDPKAYSKVEGILRDPS